MAFTRKRYEILWVNLKDVFPILSFMSYPLYTCRHIVIELSYNLTPTTSFLLLFFLSLVAFPVVKVWELIAEADVSF